MTDTTVVNFPDLLMEQMRCSVCNGYLSCGPVRLLPDGTSICGQCSPPNNDVAIYRILTLEAVLDNIVFPCRFKQQGCTESLRFGQAIDHEKNCTYCSVICPLSSLTACAWEGFGPQISDHFSEQHADYITEDFRFLINIEENSQKVFIVIKDLAFIVKYVYNAKDSSLQYDIRYFETVKIVENASYKIKLTNNLDEDYSSSLKGNLCYSYDCSFENTGKSKTLHLNKFLENLDNPSCVIFTMILKIAFKTNSNSATVDYNLLNSIRCSKCQVYLILPLFELDNQTICSNCAKSNTNCKPSNNREIQELIAKAVYPCRWRNCNFVGKSNNIKKHESSCEFACYKCIFENCETRITLAETVNHFKTHSSAIMHLPDKIVYKTSFSENYTNTHIVTIKNNTGILIQYSMVCPRVGHKLHKIWLYSLNLTNISARLDFEHQHCKLKSKVFTVDNKKGLEVSLEGLPQCFAENDILTVSIEIIDN